MCGLAVRVWCNSEPDPEVQVLLLTAPVGSSSNNGSGLFSLTLAIPQAVRCGPVGEAPDCYSGPAPAVVTTKQVCIYRPGVLLSCAAVTYLRLNALASRMLCCEVEQCFAASVLVSFDVVPLVPC